MPVHTGLSPATTITAGAPNQTHILAPGATRQGFTTAFAGTQFINYGTLEENTGSTAVTFNAAASCEFFNKAPGVAIGDAHGVIIHAAGAVRNEGLIFGEAFNGISLLNDANNNSIVNSGDIYGGQNGIAASTATAVNVSISNSGEIRGDQFGIVMEGAAGAAPVIVNSGTIIGRLNSIMAQGGDRLNVTNTGALVGSVAGTSLNQADKVINNGTVSGNVSLGSGIDLYQGTGSVSGYVNGEGGNDTLTGGALADRFNGGSEVDLLTGNGGNDVLIGVAGNDTLAGGVGIDVMAGGANADFFVFNTAPNTSTNRDILNDFVAADDTLRFENAVFAKLGNAGGLNAQFLRLGAAPLDANDYLIYNQANGVLTYDVNGNAAGGAQQVAVITTKPTLALGDFVVV
jgi:Ca2+-binding RTX toxin-like protein